MRNIGLAVLAALAAGYVAQDSFEAPDFDITNALLEQGVNVSALPELAGLVERSSDLPCSIAVSKQTECISTHC